MTFFRKSFTVSEIDTYDKCPLQYRLQYVERIPGTGLVSVDRRTDKLPAHITGDIVHNAIRRLTEEPKLEPDTAIKSAASHLGVRSISASDNAHLKVMISNFVSWRDEISAQTWLAEWPFALNLEGVLIRGTIDCLCKTPGGWIIADYKTDRIDSEDEIAKLADEYELQMSFYCIAAEAGLDSPLRSTILHFLEAGQRVEKEALAGRLSQARQKLQASVSKIRNRDYSTANHPHRPCARCPYHHNNICWGDLLVARTSW